MSNSKYFQLRAEEPDLRIVLTGKTGAGKSATGNTILRRKVFSSQICPTAVTLECQKETDEFDGQTLMVVDTPGLFDDNKNKVEVQKDFVRCISLAAPGPHVFLVVIHPNRFTEEEQQTVKIIQKEFGEEAEHYTMVLFTHGDDLEADDVSIEDFIHQNKNLSDFIHQCYGRYQVFNNRDNDPSQVHELLKKINTMVRENGGSYYTNEMFKENERAIKEEMERLQRENPEITREEARKRAEKKNWFMEKLLKVVTIGGTIGAPVGKVVGVAVEVAVAVEVGAAVGVVGGPVGAAVGAAVGALLGAGIAAAGLAIAAAVRKSRDNTE